MNGARLTGILKIAGTETRVARVRDKRKRVLEDRLPVIASCDMRNTC